MAQRTISSPGTEGGRLRGRRTASRSRRFLLAAVVLSVAVHVGVAILVVWLPRFAPRDAGPQEEGTVELLMVERKGAQPSQVGQPQESESSPLQPGKPAEVSKQQAREADAQAPDTQPIPAPPVSGAAEEPALTPTQESPQRAAKADDKPDIQQPARPPPNPQEAPVFDLAGTESESNAEVLGGRVVAASLDNRFRNRPPIYPKDAEMRGQHGEVVLVIHVAETGVATSADVAQTSGVPSLDQAALDAVRKWHFRPALRAGRAVPFDMPFRFIFDAY
jgi:periplasmic protein TonB